MAITSLSYSEYAGAERAWQFDTIYFSKINLIVGKNSTGKSRVSNVISGVSNILSGKQKGKLETGEFDVNLTLANRNFNYKISFDKGNVSSESLHIDGIMKLERNAAGEGKLYYEKATTYIDFKLPLDAVVAFAKRDEIQHPYLVELVEWASSFATYFFGTDFGRGRVLQVSDMEHALQNESALFEDPSNIAAVYAAAFNKYGAPFDTAIIKDMEKLGYILEDVGLQDIQKMLRFPIQAVSLYAKEKELGFDIPGAQLSQGMHRALSLLVNLNVCLFSGRKKTIVIDDIGEGLDYERSVALIELVIEKALSLDVQVFMTTNDMFVMNKVPLEYWTILKRSGGKVIAYNRHNAKEEFDRFKFIGLNNFDLFSSDMLNEIKQ